MKFPEYYGWTSYMAKKPGEDPISYAKRMFTWDAVMESTICYSQI